MKKIVKLSVLILTISLLSNCTKEDLRDNNTTPVDKVYSVKKGISNTTIKKPVCPVFTTDIPSFHTIVLHILQREYYHYSEKGSINMELGEYMESRLLELYPEIAYKGMYKKAIVEMDNNIKKYKQYLADLRLYEESKGIMSSRILEEETYQEYTTIEAEIEFLQMNDDEISEFMMYEKIATAETPISRKDLELLLNSKSGVLLYSVMGTAAAITGYSVWRTYQSRNRAESKTEEFFAGKTDNGEIGDAFRHIYVSVLLRNYLTVIGSWAVMSTYETIHPNPHARDTYMDYHNNAVGRYYEYWTFRGNYWSDYGKWKKWATKTRDWVEELIVGWNIYYNGINMELFYKWKSSDPDSETAKENEEDINNHNYIYYVN